ncbi:MAG: PD-(D/E)XK nuclease family protein [Bacillota bacterium]
MEAQFDFEYTPILGWSVSRYNMFQTCKRQYYYNYYGKYDKEYSYKKINRLSNLTSVPLVKGNIVHEIMKTLLQRLIKTEKKIDKDRFFEYAKKKTYKYCKKFAFAEVYYGEKKYINPEDILNDVNLCLQNFIKSKRFKWLLNQAVEYKNKWIVEPENYGETRIDDIKAYTRFDFLSPFNDQVIIIDWKTGKPDENKDRKQLLGYTTWSCFHLNQDPDDIRAILAYLKPKYSEVEISMDNYDFQSFYKQVKKETYEMRDYCKNAEKNIPKNKNVFNQTTNRYICSFCNFRELCGFA